MLGPRSRWISEFADALLDGRAALVDRGRGVCNSIDVDNLVHAIELAARTPASTARRSWSATPSA